MRPEIQALVDAFLKAKNDLTVAKDTVDEREAEEAGLEEQYAAAVKARREAENEADDAEDAVLKARDALDGSFNGEDEPDLDAEVEALIGDDT